MKPWESIKSRNEQPMGTSDPQTLSEQLAELREKYPQLKIEGQANNDVISDTG